jgi:hypothetical protein
MPCARTRPALDITPRKLPGVIHTLPMYVTDEREAVGMFYFLMRFAIS